jgi:hypothetical protein
MGCGGSTAASAVQVQPSKIGAHSTVNRKQFVPERLIGQVRVTPPTKELETVQRIFRARQHIQALLVMGACSTGSVAVYAGRLWTRRCCHQGCGIR